MPGHKMFCCALRDLLHTLRHEVLLNRKTLPQAEHDPVCVLFVCISKAHLDVLLSLATLARSPSYSRPTFIEGSGSGGPLLELSGARHPMLDAHLQVGVRKT